jgi:hypothetical protein
LFCAGDSGGLRLKLNCASNLCRPSRTRNSLSCAKDMMQILEIRGQLSSDYCDAAAIQISPQFKT